MKRRLLGGFVGWVVGGIIAVSITNFFNLQGIEAFLNGVICGGVFLSLGVVVGRAWDDNTETRGNERRKR